MHLQAQRLISVLTCISIGACAKPSPTSEPDTAPVLSPDSAHIAYVNATVTSIREGGGERKYLTEAVSVRWSSAKSPSVFQEVMVDERGLNGWREWLSRSTHVQFSPDSRHLAVVFTGGILIVDVQSGQSWAITTAPRVSSIAWLNKDEVLYVVNSHPRRFYRQQITSLSKPTLLYEAEADSRYDPLPGRTGYSAGWPTEYWSPDGRHSVFWNQAHWNVLEVDSRLVQAVPSSQQSGGAIVAFWKPDGSGFLCITGDEEHGYEVFIVAIPGFSMLDLSRDFTHAFGGEHLQTAFDYPGMTCQGTRWTGDGKFFIVNVKGDGFLVCPRPWKVIDIGKLLRERLGVSVPASASVFVELQPTTLDSWVRAHFSPTGTYYFLNHTSGTLIPVLSLSASRGTGPVLGPVLSPDGLLVAYVQSPIGAIVQSAPMQLASQPHQ